MRAGEQDANSSSILSAAAIFSLFMMLFGYWFSTLFVPAFSTSTTVAQAASDVLLLLFWVLLTVFTFGVVLRDVSISFIRTIRTRLWAQLLFPAYLAVHLVIYGVVLEKIIVLAYGAPPLSLGPRAYLVFNYYFTPHTLFNALIQITQNPGIVLVLPPFYGVTLGPFAIFSAFLIGVLVTVHTDRLLRISGKLRKAGGSVVYPAVGIVGGASCCISLPDLAASISPFATVAFTTPLWTNVLYALYYVLPISVIVAFVATLMPRSRRGR